MDEWISVKERLPEPNVKDESNFFIKAYLVARCNGFTMHTALWDGKHWVLWTYGRVLKDVTHWMPLPEKPNTQKGEQL